MRQAGSSRIGLAAIVRRRSRSRTGRRRSPAAALLEATDVPASARPRSAAPWLARAALDGRLDTERLRALPEADASPSSRRCPASARGRQAILTRGCGPPTRLPLATTISRDAVAAAYGLPEPPTTRLDPIAEAWRPYRMWATVLLRMAWRARRPGRRATGSARRAASVSRPARPRARPTRRRSSARPASRRRSCCDERALAQPDRRRGHLDQLVGRR